MNISYKSYIYIIYIYIYVNTYIHTHTHTHIYTHWSQNRLTWPCASFVPGNDLVNVAIEYGWWHCNIHAQCQQRQHRGASTCCRLSHAIYLYSHSGARISSPGCALRACLGRNLSPRKAIGSTIHAHTASAKQHRSLHTVFPQGRSARLSCK